MNILQINSSARRDASHSSRLAGRIVLRLRDADPGATLTVRDLDRTPQPVQDEAALGALFAPPDTQVPYLRTVLGFLGMTDVHFVYAEGLSMGPDAEQEAIASAYEQIEEAVAA